MLKGVDALVLQSSDTVCEVRLQRVPLFELLPSRDELFAPPPDGHRALMMSAGMSRKHVLYVCTSASLSCGICATKSLRWHSMVLAVLLESYR